MTKIKICGLRRPEDIAIVNDYLPDYAGFIIDFPASFRSIAHEEVKNLTSKLDKRILPVGVFVDAPIEIVIDLLKGGALGAAQLHGSEPPEYIMKVQEATGKPVIKTFVMPRQNASQKQETQGFQETERICVPQNIQRPEDETNSRWRPQTNDLTNTASAAYRKAAENILESAAYSPADRILLDAGKGSGQTFNWDLLTGFSRPFFLAGGISAENISDAIETLHPYAVDISSSVESDRFKDRQKVKNIIEKVRKGNIK